MEGMLRFILCGWMACAWPAAAATEFQPARGDRIAVLGGTLAERMQYSGYVETLLHLRFPGHNLTVRNLGWSGDTVDLMPRPLGFGDLESHLTRLKADVILLCFGGNESFDGKDGLDKFRRGLEKLIERLRARSFNGKTPPRLVVVSPIAHEDIGGRFPDPRRHNYDLERYTRAMAEVARARDLPFVDLFKPTRAKMRARSQLTINGIHLNERGQRLLAEELTRLKYQPAYDSLRQLVVEKNRLFFLRWRPVNGEYVFGRRKKPFGVLTYPPEMAQLDQMIAEMDERIHAEAKRLGGAR